MKKKFTKWFTMALVMLFVLSTLVTGCGKPAESGEGNQAQVKEPAENNGPVENDGPGGNGGTEEAEPAPANTQKSEETLIVAHPAEPTKLTPLNGPLTNHDVAPFDTMTATLFKINYETYEAEPYLVTEYEEIDSTHYRLKMREDAVYADGTPITAHDVIWTFNRYAEKGVMFATYLKLEECVAEDDYTVVLAFKEHTPGWYNELTREGIYNEKLVEAAGGFDEVDRNPPVGGGRYVFSEWKPGEYILVERNENYWDKDYVGYYKYIKFIFVPDAASRVMAVQSGDADMASILSVSQVLALESDPGVNGELLYNGNVLNLYFNNEKGIFAENPRLREAVALAIDPEAINQVINMGQGQVAQGIFCEENAYYHEVYPDGKKPYDLEKAKQILKEEGYENGFSCYSPATADNETILTILKEQLRAINVDLQFDILDTSVAGPEGRAGNYDVTLAPTAHYVLSSANFEQINPDKIGIAFASLRITDPAIKELIGRASSPDLEVKKQGWIDVQEYLFNNYCLVGLCTRYEGYALKDGLTGVRQLYRPSQYSVTDVRPQ